MSVVIPGGHSTIPDNGPVLYYLSVFTNILLVFSMVIGYMLVDGTLVRGSTGLHTHCGSDACSASPCGDRTTTAQRRSLERATSEVAMRRSFSEHVQPVENIGQVVLR